MADLVGDSLIGTVRDIWRRVLKVDDVAPEDDFFELGGHSLNAMRVVAMLHRDVADDVGIDMLLGNPEFAEFVHSLAEHLAAGSHDSAPSDESARDEM